MNPNTSLTEIEERHNIKDVCKICPDCVEDGCRPNTNDWCRTCAAIDVWTAQKVQEARIDELQNRLRVQFIPSHWARLCAETNSWAKYVDRRIAELTSNVSKETP